MTFFIEIATRLANFIHGYPLFYFGTTAFFLLIMIYFLLKNHNRFLIKKIKRLLHKNPEKALQMLINKDLYLIEHFLKKDNLDSSKLLKVRKFLSEHEQLKRIYSKILSSEDDPELVKVGLSILDQIPGPQAQ